MKLIMRNSRKPLLIDPGVEAAWAAEIERRASRTLSGVSEGVEDWEEVRARINREILGREANRDEV